MGRVLISGEPGVEIIPALMPEDGEIVIDKPGKGMFWATGLHDMLLAQGVTHLVFTGVTTEVCVQTSMREANDRGYDCLIVEDATESYFPEFKAAALAMIAAQGAIVGWHTPSEVLLGAIA
jgi:nicotinamidase-related amidase